MGVADRLAPSDGGRQARRAQAWMRHVLDVLSPGGARGRLSILIFHRVHAQPDALYPNVLDAAAFLERMLWVKTWFNVLPLDEGISHLQRRSLPARAMAITFDDGYADNATVAMPILRRLGLPATFFVATGFLNGGRMWNDSVIEAVRAAPGPELNLSSLGLDAYRIGSLDERRSAISVILSRLKYLPGAKRQELADAIAASSPAAPVDLMMTTEQLQAIAAAGMDIGAHTVTHPILLRIDEAAARREMADGRDTLAAIVRQAIRVFAYPNGRPGVDYGPSHVDMVRGLGFLGAVTTVVGAARVGDSAYELPRFTPWGRTPGLWAFRFARGLSRRVALAAA